MTRMLFLTRTWLCFLLTIPSIQAWSSSSPSRRAFLQQTGTAAVVLTQAPAAWADTSLLEELVESKEKLAPIPQLLEEKEWDKVRTILKMPPVNKLWNLGDVSGGLFISWVLCSCELCRLT